MWLSWRALSHVFSELGIPLAACIQMQSMGLKLGEAKWTARSTNTGFSVSFFSVLLAYWMEAHNSVC